MILLTGATGTTGNALCPLIAGGGVPVRALVRNTSRARPLAELGIDLVCGDLDDIRSVEQAMAGVERAFLLAANSQQQLQQEQNFIDVAKRKGVKGIVKFSAIGADIQSPAELKRFHGAGEKYLQDSGLEFTHLRPAFFMQNLLFCAQTICTERKFYLPMAAARVGVIDVRDVAEIICKLLTEDVHKGKTYVVTGPQLLDFAEVADIFSAALGHKIEYVNLPAAVFREQLRQWQPDEWYMDAVSDLFECIRCDEQSVVTETFEQLTGRPPATFARFVHDHSEAFAIAN